MSLRVILVYDYLVNNRIGKAVEKINIAHLVEKNVALKALSSYNTGGQADLFAQPKNLEEAQELIKWAINKNIPYTVLGGGSNVLISDEGVEGLVISTASLLNYHIRGRIFVVEAGLLVDKAINISIENFLSGLEALGGLPGSIGGAVWGNSQAAGLSIAELIEWVDYIDNEGSLRRLHAIDSKFSYKSSPFMTKNSLIFEVAFRLEPTKDSSAARQFKEKQRKIRFAKGQFDFPSAGCYFKNSGDISSGKLIDEAQLKQLSVGGAAVSPTHANFIINKDNRASSADIYQLGELIRKEILKKYNIDLEREVVLIGRWNN